jgi:hypothetical protein
VKEDEMAKKITPKQVSNILNSWCGDDIYSLEFSALVDGGLCECRAMARILNKKLVLNAINRNINK